jgi:hypothetical protein
MKNLLVAFLLTAFVGGGYIAKASSAFDVIIKEDEKDKKDKKSCSDKKSCCKMKSGEAKACAGMTKDGEAKASASTDGAASATATTTGETKSCGSGEKKSCCKHKGAEKTKATGAAL